MNLPNKLTILRTIMIPVFLIFLYIPGLGMTGDVLAAAIFVLASFTDLLDGKIARKYNLVTNFGKFMDPLADKLLVCSALIALVDLNRIPAWVVIIIIAREFIISGFRLIASDNGVVIAASYWGKFKTTFQMIMIILLILNIDYPYSNIVNLVIMYIALALTIISLLDYIIKNDCSNVSVINNAQRKLVVANDLRDMVVVNTEDAVYISSQKSADNIKEIVKDNMNQYETYFDYNRISYREWGIHELLNYSKGYKVKKVTVFPGMMMNLHQHELRAEYWSVVEGTATITLGTETKDYHKYESVFVPVGTKHRVANKTDKNVVIIEVGIGDSILENDLVKIYGYETGNNEGNYVRSDSSPIVKLDPAFKDNLWGGTKIRDVFGKKCDYDVIGESWELSAHPDGQSRIADGYYKGMLFNDYLTIIGKEALGWKCQAQDRFPVLIKFIDAKQALSIQIHPDDEYALENENEYGKNEMWYVLDAEPGAYLYCGLSRDSSREEIEERIKNNTITEILNRIDVKKGDVVMVKAGTIHAIGAGIFICEIQQNSNCTYRMYDYDRRDKFGNPRELHVAKSLDVVNPVKYVRDNKCNVMLTHNEHYMAKRLVQCKYFEVIKYEVEDEAKIPVDEASFVSVIVVEGEGTIMTDDYDKEMKFKAGESFFISAGKRNIIVNGKSTCIVTHV